VAAPKFEFKSVLTRNLLDPERHKGTPFTFVHCRDTKEVFFTDADGNYINFGSILAAVMNGSLPMALPASPVAGPQGPQGIPGPKGESIVGPQGPQGIPGPQGDLKVVGDAEILAALNELKAQRARHIAAIRHAIEENKHPSRARWSTAQKFVEMSIDTIRAESGITREELK
jgi:hypothetical protein